MKQVDYIIVGLGIAGLTFCEQLHKNNKTFVVFDTGDYSSTRVSAGIINPMVLKRFTPVWKAQEHIHSAFKFYEDLEKKLMVHFFSRITMLRIFTSMEEQNNWMVATDKKELTTFLDPNVLKNSNPNINAPYGFGKVNYSARIDTKRLLSAYAALLQNQEQLIHQPFNYLKLKETKKGIEYKNIIASKIVFCEGASSRQNPFFNRDYLIPLKGEFITISASKLQLDDMLKTSIFMIPLGGDLYKVGATYKREDFSYNSTSSAKKELIEKTKNTIKCSFKVKEQVAGIRPTTKDRRPLLGNLYNKNMYFFTGLGTRGLMTAPSLAKQLYGNIEINKPLDKEINITRMDNKNDL